MILFSDFDKTLFFEYNLQQYYDNLKAIQKWRSSGHLFIVATGRSLFSLFHVLPKHYCNYYITDNGSNIYDHNQTLLSTTTFSESAVTKILDFVATNAKDQAVPIFYNATAESATKLPNLTKIRFWFADELTARNVLPALRKINPKTFLSINTKSPYHEVKDSTTFLELVPTQSGKNTAVKKLLQLLQFQTSAAIVVGDSENDRDMLADFNGFMIQESELHESGANFKTTTNLSALINNLLTNPNSVI